MGTVRRRMLPRGWYPATGEECRREIEGYLAEAPARPEGSLERVRGAVVPHAGWMFSGRLAAWALAAAAAGGPEVVVLFGGHLGRGAPQVVLADAWETPLGEVRLARGLAEELGRRLSCEREPDEGDNTIEIHLPMIAHIMPGVQVLAVRAPHDEAAMRLGREAAGLCHERGLKCCFIGSTDLTHYGPNYGFMPVGSGAKAQEWVRGVNDARFIEAALKLDAPGLLRLAAEEESACSAGAAAAAVEAGRAQGAERGHLLGRYLSSDVAAYGESFVGYAAIVF